MDYQLEQDYGEQMHWLFGQTIVRNVDGSNKSELETWLFCKYIIVPFEF